MKSAVIRLYLVLGVSILWLVSIYIAFSPQAYLISLTGIDGFNSLSLISDLRGMGGMLFFIATYIFVCMLRQPKLEQALTLIVLVFTSFVVMRTVGFVLDGLPSMLIVLAYFIECVFMILGLLLLRVQQLDNVTLNEAH